MTKIEQARSEGRRAAINGKPNVIPTARALEMTQAEVFAWREGYAEMTGQFVLPTWDTQK